MIKDLYFALGVIIKEITGEGYEATVMSIRENDPMKNAWIRVDISGASLEFTVCADKTIAEITIRLSNNSTRLVEAYGDIGDIIGSLEVAKNILQGE